jgi:hypothetical protein
MRERFFHFQERFRNGFGIAMGKFSEIDG